MWQFNYGEWTEAKVKQFLYDSFAGMTATNEWSGEKLRRGTGDMFIKKRTVDII